MKEKILITTPIYYVNWKPHIWHVYSSLIADSFARAKRSLWYDVKFSTWVDENSQKAVEKANQQWKNIYEYLNEMSLIHKKIWDLYNISYTDFIKTTSKKHEKLVNIILKKTYKNWYIYKNKYKWYYCSGCEAFKKEKDLIERNWQLVCSDHLIKPDIIEEENYFFALSKFEKFLKNLYKENSYFVIPKNRFNEVKKFVEEWLEDFSISREWKTFWIKFPFDENHVVYVWYDALFNYYTVSLDDDLNELWYFNDNIYHVIWKDIVKFHAIYWPCMLKAINLPIPKKIFTTWFFTINWQKMSKSLWNTIDPIEVIEKYWRDAISLYLFYDIKIWKDWDFSFSRFEDIYNNILIWGLWNLVYRVSKLAEKFNVKIWYYHNTSIKNELLEWILNKNIEKIIENYFEEVNYKSYLKRLYKLIQDTNKYIQDKEPWKIIKEDQKEWIKILETSIYLIHKINLLWSFILIEWYKKINETFWFAHLDNSKNFDWFLDEIYKTEIKIDTKPQIIYKKIEEANHEK